MPLRTNSKSRTSKSRSKSISKSMKSIKSKSMRSYKRKYHGGCNSCDRAGSKGSGASSTGDFWTSSGTMRGGASPEQLSNDTFNHVTDKMFYSAA